MATNHLPLHIGLHRDCQLFHPLIQLIKRFQETSPTGIRALLKIPRKVLRTCLSQLTEGKTPSLLLGGFLQCLIF